MNMKKYEVAYCTSAGATYMGVVRGYADPQGHYVQGQAVVIFGQHGDGRKATYITWHNRPMCRVRGIQWQRAMATMRRYGAIRKESAGAWRWRTLPSEWAVKKAGEAWTEAEEEKREFMDEEGED